MKDEREVIVISNEAADRMLEVLENPPQPNEYLMKTSRRHNEMKKCGKIK